MINDGTIHSTFNEGHMRVEGETAYCLDINTGFKNGYKTRHDASASMSAAQIEDVALSLEYVKQYRGSHSNLNANQGYLLEQCVVWQRLSEPVSYTHLDVYKRQGQSFHQPTELLSCKFLYFRFISWPYKTAFFKTFIQKQESVLFPN